MSSIRSKNKPAVGALFAVIAIVVGLSQSSVAQSKFSKEVMRPVLWQKMKFVPSAECSIGLQDCADSFLKEAGVNMGTPPIYEFFMLGVGPGGRNSTVAFVTQRMAEDDSVAEIRYRLVLRLDDDDDKSYKLVNLGRQFKCSRGRNYWSKARCR